MPTIMEWVPTEPAQTAPSDVRPAMRTISPTVNFTPVPAPVRARVVEEVMPATQQVRPSPALRTTPVVAPRAPARTTLAEHRRHNPAVAPANPAVTTNAPTRARINMDEVLNGSDRARPGPVVTSSPAQEADYWAALLGKLRAVHEKPATLDDGLSARVEFVLRPDGTVGEVRILTSSGSAAFDASVIAAFRRLSGLGLPPAGAAGLNQVTFHTRAE